jgi:hypothetical protein
VADHGHESITVKADPATIMGVIADFPAYTQWAGPVKRVDVLETGGDGRASKVRFHVEMYGIPDVYVNEYTWTGDTHVAWQMVEGRSLKSQVGSYELTPDGDRTTVTYDLTVEIQVPIPGLIRRKLQGKVVDTALKDLKKRAEA